jgi:type III secretion system HrpE/YscL family protein
MTGSAVALDLRPGMVIKRRTASVLVDAEALRAAAEAELASARSEAAEIREAARADGRLEGLAEAAVTSARMLAATQMRLQEMTDTLAPSLAKAVTDAVARIIGAPTEPDVVARLLEAALQGAARHRHLQLYVWPEAVDGVNTSLAGIFADQDRVASDWVSVHADPRLAPGRMVLATDQGYVELGVAEQLDAAGEALTRHIDAELVGLETAPAETQDPDPGTVEGAAP